MTAGSSLSFVELCGVLLVCASAQQLQFDASHRLFGLWHESALYQLYIHVVGIPSEAEFDLARMVMQCKPAVVCILVARYETCIRLQANRLCTYAS